MKRRATFALIGGLVVAAGAAAIFLATASAGLPPISPVIVARTSGPPAAGKLFTGLLIDAKDSADSTPAPAIVSVSCSATVAGVTVRSRQHRFYATGYRGPKAITCSWLIPAAAAGKKLRAHFDVVVGYGTGTAGHSVWTIKR